MRSILIDGLSRPVRLQDFDLIEAARNGEVGMGGFDVDSLNAAFSFNSHKTVSVFDTEAAANIFTGFVGDKDLTRGPFAVMNDRQFDTNIVDLNTMLIDDIMTGADANRPEETDIQRVTWLVGTSFLNGMGANIGGAGAVTLEASDYRTQQPLSLLTQAAEVAGKLFFVYWDLAANGPKLFYDLATSSNFITSHKISTLLADGSNPQTHYPVQDTFSRRLDGGRIYSELLFKYDGGSVTVTNAATASNFKSRKTVLYDNTVKTSSMATRKANQYLANASTEEEVISVEVLVPDEEANVFRAGQLMQIKAPHLGLPTFTDRRIVRTSKKPRVDTDEEGYRISMELSIPTATRFGARGTPIDTLPDDVGNQPPTTPADTEGISCGLVGPYTGVSEYEDAVPGEYVLSGIPSYPGSWLAYNVPYTNGDGCSIGPGGFKWFLDQEVWWQFTAPADSATYLGLQVDLAPVGTSGHVAGLLLGLANVGPSTTSYHKWHLVGEVSPSETRTYIIPRNFVNWGGTNSIVLAPNWRCDRPNVFVCTTSFSGPVATGEANSGRYGPVSAFIEVCTTRYVSGTTGMSDWVPGYGVTDGTNHTFTLVYWTGDGTPEVMLNGSIVPTDDVTFNTSAKTASLTFPPAPGSSLLFNYEVEAA